MAQIILHDILTISHNKHPMVPIKEYVDDLVMRAEGTAMCLTSWVPEAARTLLGILTDSGLKLANKKTIGGASTPPRRRFRTPRARAHAHLYQQAGHGRD